MPRGGWLGSSPGMRGLPIGAQIRLGFITRDARVTHRGPNWIGMHHPRMGGLPIGAQVGWNSSPRFGWDCAWAPRIG
eukprot:4328069-Prymnesium_polylepis.1